MNTACIALITFLAVVQLAAARKQDCPLFQCKMLCKYGNKISEVTKCPTCGCKTMEEATQCQLEWAISENSPFLGKFTRACDSFGDYKAKQCFENFCGCVDNTGKPFTEWKLGQEGQDLKCNCLRETQDLKTGVNPPIGTYNPRCGNDGSYEKIQCNGSTGYCWCADPDTGRRMGDQVRGVPSC